MRNNLETQPVIRTPCDDMIGTLIAISLAAKQLAAKAGKEWKTMSKINELPA